MGGYLANSIAIMSDSAHLLSDLTSFIVSLVAIYLAMQPASKKMNFGYYRAGEGWSASHLSSLVQFGVIPIHSQSNMS